MKAVEQQIQDTGQVGKMTSKEKVLSVYPDAYVAHFNAGMAIKNEANNIFLSDDYTHDSEEDAWDDAASKLPSAPSPAEETAQALVKDIFPEAYARDTERGGFDIVDCIDKDRAMSVGYGKTKDGAWIDAASRQRKWCERHRQAPPCIACKMESASVPEPVSTEEVCGWHEVFCPQPKGHSGDCFTQPRKIAAPIAPAAVSEEKRMLDAIETARALGYRDGHIDGRKEARSQFAKPSAEGDGWIEDGVALIAAERKRQVESEGWTPEHDDNHDDGEMANAAACYAVPHTMRLVEGTPSLWPWECRFWKPSPDPIRNLVKAGALIAAEIDRLKRVPAPPSGQGK